MQFNTELIKSRRLNSLLKQLGESTIKWLESEEGQKALEESFKPREPLYKPMDSLMLLRRITICLMILGILSISPAEAGILRFIKKVYVYIVRPNPTNCPYTTLEYYYSD